MSEEQMKQEDKNICDCSKPNKVILLIGILLGISIISTVAFFVLLFKTTGCGMENKKTEDNKVKSAVEGAEVNKEEAPKMRKEDCKYESLETEEIDEKKLVITSKDHIKGNKKAFLTIVIYDDFECPYCGAFEGVNQRVIAALQGRDICWDPVMPNLIKDYIDTGKVKLVYRHFPLSPKMHPNAQPAAEASECAGAQGKFWEMHDMIFEMNNSNSLSLENFKQAARDLKLNMDKYNVCMDKHKMAGRVKADSKSGESLGVSGTPAIIIGDKLVAGAVPYGSFKIAVEEALNK